MHREPRVKIGENDTNGANSAKSIVAYYQSILNRLFFTSFIINIFKLKHNKYAMENHQENAEEIFLK